jgi:hypothetical protein
MKTTTALTAAALATTIATTPVAAQVRNIAGSGSWVAFTGKANDGKPVCGMTASNTTTGRFINIKWFKGNKHLTLQAFAKGWNLPVGVQMPVHVNFDESDERREFVGIGNKGGKSTYDFVEFRLHGDFFTDFMEEVGGANRMIITFPDGNELPWAVDMTGSRDISRVFTNCIANTLPTPAPQATQPHIGKATQPHSGKATQPHGTQPSQRRPSPDERGA